MKNLRKDTKANKGYLLLSALWLLIFSGIFSQGIIKISANHIIQLKQISTAYQAKSALNMSEQLLKKYIQENTQLPEEGTIQTSVGTITVTKKSKTKYMLILTEENQEQYVKETIVTLPKIEDETTNKK